MDDGFVCRRSRSNLQPSCHGAGRDSLMTERSTGGERRHGGSPCSFASIQSRDSIAQPTQLHHHLARCATRSFLHLSSSFPSPPPSAHLHPLHRLRGTNIHPPVALAVRVHVSISVPGGYIHCTPVSPASLTPGMFPETEAEQTTLRPCRSHTKTEGRFPSHAAMSSLPKEEDIWRTPLPPHSKPPGPAGGKASVHAPGAVAPAVSV